MFQQLKRVFIGFGVLLASLVSLYALNNPVAFQTDPVGNAEYIYVYNSDNVTHEVGDVVVYFDGTYDGVEISTTTTANNALVAGVVAIKDIPATSWGLVQVYGYHGTITTDGSVAAGDTLVTSTTGEACMTYSVAQATGTLTGQSNSYGILGVALTTDSGTVGTAFIKCK